MESWCTDAADQEYLPLGELIHEHIIPLTKKRDIFHDVIRPFPILREILESMEQHSQACAGAINQGDFDLLFVNACMYLRTSPIAKYVKLPSVIYLGEPYRWFYEAMPTLPWIVPHEAPKRKLVFDVLRSLFTRQTETDLDSIQLQARTELAYANAFDQILVNSIFSRETILRTYNLESKVCYLGIDTDYYRPTGDPKANFIVGLGTLYYGKGVDRAIRAVGTIDKTKRPDLIWIGNGASEQDLDGYHSLARELEVTFVPKIQLSDAEVIDLLSRAVAMIYTSRLEPFGLAPLEANACGTAVVGIAEGGMRETIRDGVNGYLSKDDDPQVLGELIRRFVDNPELAVKMGVQARDYVKETWNMAMCTDNIESALFTIYNSTGMTSNQDGIPSRVDN